MPLAKLAVRQPVFISMVLLALVVIGTISYVQMGVDMMPNVEFPVAAVITPFPGAGPEEVETLITKPVEESLSTISGLDTIMATSSEGMSQVIVQFVIGRNIQDAVQEVRERIERLRPSLPDGSLTPQILRFDPSDTPIMTLAIGAKDNSLSLVSLRRIADDDIKPRLERIPGLAAAEVSGGLTREIQVYVAAEKMKSLVISPQQVVGAIQRENITLPAGRIDSRGEELLLRTDAEFSSPEEIARIVVGYRGTTPIYLREIAQTKMGFKENRQLTRLNGRDTVVVELRKQSGSNVVKTAQAVRQEFQKIARDIPSVNLVIVSDQSVFIQESERDVNMTLILGALFAAIVVFIFFRNLRNTFITVIGLPVIVISTFIFMSIFGFTRNVISLMALSLAIGLLIDDAIVVRENIFRHIENGASPKVAAEEATGEIAFAVLAITLTIVAVFVPVAFAKGLIGVIFREFGITVAMAVLISLFEAFTLGPLLAAYFAKPLAHSQQSIGGLKQTKGIGYRFTLIWDGVVERYRHFLAWALNYRWVVICVAIGLLVGSISLLRYLPQSFFPSMDPGEFWVGVKMPPGTPLSETDRLVRHVEEIVRNQPEVRHFFSKVGSSGGGGEGGSVFVKLRETGITESIMSRLEGELKEDREHLSFSVAGTFGGGASAESVSGRPIQLVVRGTGSSEELNKIADEIVQRMQSIPGIRDIGKSWEEGKPELKVLVDRDRAGRSGVSALGVAGTVRTLVNGQTATRVTIDNKELDVVVRLREEDRANADGLLDIPMSNIAGQQVPLRTVARTERGTGPSALERRDRQRQIVVGANLAGRSQGAVNADLQKSVTDIQLPIGVTLGAGGEQEFTEDAFSSLMTALLLGVLFVYMVLASQFGSLVHPFTIMTALPFSIVGALIALLAVRADFSVMAMIGIIMLMGLVTKNSILLVDFIIRGRKQGQERTAAVLEAGPMRLRPILMTTLSIILGMLPTALGMGEGGTFRAPMAIAVIGGMISSTLLSLVVVPVVYTLLDDGVNGVSKLFRRKATTTEIQPEE